MAEKSGFSTKLHNFQFTSSLYYDSIHFYFFTQHKSSIWSCISTDLKWKWARVAMIFLCHSMVKRYLKSLRSFWQKVALIKLVNSPPFILSIEAAKNVTRRGCSFFRMRNIDWSQISTSKVASWKFGATNAKTFVSTKLAAFYFRSSLV